MSEDAGAAAEGTGTGPDGTGSATTTSTADTQATTANGTQGAPSGPEGTGTTGDDTAAAETLADMAAAGDSDQDQNKPDALQTQLDHWKNIAKKQEQRAKSNAAAAKELEDIKRSQMSAQERLETERDQYRAEAASNAEQLHRVMAAAAYDLPPSLLDHLGGGTEEEINARAEAFAAAINERVTQGNGQGSAEGNGHSTAEAAAAAAQQQPANPFFRNKVPVESLRAGAAPANDNIARNTNDLFRQMLGR